MEELDNFNSAEASSSADLKRYVWLMLRWWWLLGLAALLAGAGAFIFSRYQTPIFRATTIVLINEATPQQVSDATAITLTNDKLMSTYAEMLTKKPLLDQVFRELGMPAASSMEEAGFDISVAQVKTTQLLALNVEGADPVRAAIIANALVKDFAAQLSDMQVSRYQDSKLNLQNQMTYLELQIQASSGSLDKIIQANIATLKARMKSEDPANAGAVTADLEIQARQMNQAEIDPLETRLAQYRQIYASVLSSYEQIRLVEAQTTTKLIQVEPAIPPESPIRPKTTQNTLLAAVVGLLLAVGVVFAFEYLDDTIKDPDAVTAQTGLPILATISHFAGESDKPIAQLMPRSPISEAFRSLRTNIQFAGVDSPLKRLIITSPTPEDGKTTVAANLAVVMAQGGKRVTLIDADLRRPRIHKLLGLQNKLGLSSLFIQAEVYLNGNLQRTEVGGLRVIASGDVPPNPSELLGSMKMKEILNLAQANSDFIIMDTPPVLSVTDACVLSSCADGVLIVIKVGQTKQAAFFRAVEQLRQVKAKIIGVVLNEVNPAHSYYYYKNYDYYHYDDSSNAQGPKKHKSKGAFHRVVSKVKLLMP